jgi:hypothetical protein
MLHGVGLFGAGESVPGEAGDGRGFPCGVVLSRTEQGRSALTWAETACRFPSTAMWATPVGQFPTSTCVAGWLVSGAAGVVAVMRSLLRLFGGPPLFWRSDRGAVERPGAGSLPLDPGRAAGSTR